MAEPASARVFGLPELLERILIDLGNIIQKKTSPIQPATQLFVLTRVNNTFYETITESAPLQQLMGLQALPEMESDVEYRSMWINWLAAQFEGSVEHRSEKIYGGQNGTPNPLHLKVVKITLDLRSLAPQANHPLLTYPQDNGAWCIMPLTLTAHPDNYPARNFRLDFGNPSFSPLFACPHGATLGELMMYMREDNDQAVYRESVKRTRDRDFGARLYAEAARRDPSPDGTDE